jgi:class 3 adenylate cyclase/tetratricopeptide (TPR) repeat protein
MTAVESTICPVCGHANKPGRKFCGNCGSALPIFCPICGEANDPGDRFCGNCGSPLSAAQERTPATPHRPPAADSMAVPDHTARQDKERRLVTILFSDIVGSTTLGERLDPEEIDELVGQVHAIVEQSVARYGGHVVRHMGDGLLAIFGAPVAREDDAERAVLAALEMQQRLTHFNAEARTTVSGGATATAPQMRIGITSGEVVAGAIGGVYDVVGDAANTAARLQNEAPIGGVLVGEETMRLAQRRIRYAERRELSLKGKAEPVPAYTVLGLTGRLEERWELSQRLSPLLGREHELDLMFDAWRRASAAGEGQLLTLIGDAGVGKSRLIAEFTERIADGTTRVVRGRCLSYSQGMSLWLMADLLRGICSLDEQAPTDEARAGLTATISSLLPGEAQDVHNEAIDVLGEAMGLGVSESLVTNAGAQVRRQALLRALRLMLAALAANAPLLVVLEDLHWVDTASEEILASVLADVPGLRLLVLVSQRPGWIAPWNEWSWPERLSLRPLEAEDATRLAISVLALPLSAELERYVADRAGGNPFFVEELLHTLQERGDIVQQEGQAHVAPGAVERLPSTLTEVLLARLDRLEGDARSIAQMASVIGRSFAVRLLAWIAEREESMLEPPLAALQRAEIAFPRPGPDPAYVFRHATIREVAYNMLVHKRRQQLHLAAARAVTDLYPGDEYVDIIAYHYARTEEHCEAAEWLERAGDRAAGVYANESALSSYADARTRLERCDPATRGLCRLDEKRGVILRTCGRYDEAIAVLEGAAAVYHAAVDRDAEGRVLAYIGEAHYARGTTAQGIDRLQPFLAQSDPDPAQIVSSSCVASVHAAMALLYFASGRYADALSAAERASICARAAGDKRVEARAEVSRGLALLALDRRADARRVLEEAVPLAESSGDLESLARALENLSNIHSLRGEVEASEAYLRRGLEVARRMGDPALTVHMLFMLGTNRIFAGEWDISWSYQEQAEEVARSLGESRVSVLPLFGKARLTLQRGDWDTAVPQLEEVVRIAERHGILPIVKWAQRNLAEGDLLAGRPQAALDRLLPLLARPGLEDSPLLLAVVGQAYVALGNEAQAQATIARALERARADEDHAEISEALLAAAMLAIRQNRWDDARDALDQGVTMDQRTGYLWALARFLYEYGRMHQLRGEPAEARRRWEEARAIFARLGARRYLDMTEQALAGLDTSSDVYPEGVRSQS